MPEPTVAPYGAWTSPLTADLIVAGTIGLGAVALDGQDVYWVEARPTEAGRQVIVRRTPDGKTVDVNPAPFNARTRVHEYGGGEFTVVDGTVFFANFADQRLYRQVPGGEPWPISPAVDLRYADFSADRRRNRLVCIREDHTVEGREAVNTVVAVDVDGSDDGGTVLVAGYDFFSTPRVSPGGSRLAWLAWNHPNMPWDGTELWVGEIAADGALARTERVAGGVDESIFQPEWSPDGVLHFVAEQTGWWNLYRWRDGAVEALCPMEAEFGLPQWVFGMSTYGFVAPNRIVCAFKQRGQWQLVTLDTDTGTLTPIVTPYTDVEGIQAAGTRVVFAAASPTEPESIVQLDPGTNELTVLRRASDLTIDPGYLSIPRAIEFPTEGGLTAHGFFYPPANRDFVAPSAERPPLLVFSHGGPTGATATSLSLRIQYWTSRGLAVLDVNYGGSTGYGRAYRQRLDDQWGIVDVDDCANGARFLADRGDVDGNRLAIRGGSAGGYTTLAALTFRDTFNAGASHFGISDLEAMTKETHKFESRYLDRLIGPYPARRDIYVERSPIHFIDRLACPLILFQGLEDKVVPPNQAEMMFDAMRQKGLPVAYVPFAGEQHGFRRAENIKRSLEGELYFYGRVFGFTPSDAIEPVAIANL